MNKDEFISKYGNVKVKFHCYYKFIFTFKGLTDDGNDLFCHVGGTSDDIYRYEVDADFEYKLIGIDVNSARVYDSDVLIDEFSDD